MTWKSAAHFYRQLSLVHRAGISIADGVAMAGAASRGHHRELAQAWSRGCAGGSQFADQLEASHEEPLAVALIRAGERSGKVPEMASLLAEHYEHRISLRGLIIARLVYPVLLLHIALLVPTVVMVFLKGWPLWTIPLGPVILWAIATAVIVSELASRRSGFTARLMVRPPFAFLAMPMIVANTCQVVRGGLAAGMLVPDALELAAGGCGNRAMAARLRDAADAVRHERLPNLAAALGACGFPSTELGMLKNAEYAGKLEEVLAQVAVVSEESFRTRALWASKIFTGAIYGVALLMAVAAILAVASLYVGLLTSAANEIDQ